MPIDRNNTAIIVLGASDFGKSQQLVSDESFLNSKEKVLAYFKDGDELNLQEENVLDFFNAINSPDEIDFEIGNFITNAITRGTTDLFVYYVGHGFFSPLDRSFLLAASTTRDDNKHVSSISFKNLAGTISRFASEIRSFIILDCCFSGAGHFEFIVGEDAFIDSFRDEFPKKGVAILCSTSKDLQSLIVRERNLTMFSEALALALQNGDSSINKKYLTLRELKQITYSFIKRNNPNDDIRPEIFSPIQSLGDIADIPTFINHGFKYSTSDILAQKKQIEGELIKNNIKVIGNLLIDFVRNFDILEQFRTESIIIASKCYDLIQQRRVLSLKEFEKQRTEIFIQVLSILRKILRQPLQGPEINPVFVTTVFPNEIIELKQSLQSDFVTAFPELLNFLEKTNAPWNIQKNTVLLGSELFDLIENESDPTKRELKTSAILKIAIDLLTQHSVSFDHDGIEKADWHISQLRNRFISKQNNDIIFEAKDIRKKYPGFKLTNISLQLRVGEITCLAGENGAGKTTLVKIIVGELAPSGGDCIYNLDSNDSANWSRIKRGIGYVPQRIPKWSNNATLKEYLHLTAAAKNIFGKKNDELVEFVLVRLGLKKIASGFSTWDTLSTGYQLRFELAKQLILEPRLLVLDEPLANLDLKARANLLSDLRSLSTSLNSPMAVLISTQNIAEVEIISDKVIFLTDGECTYNGTPDEIINQTNKNYFVISTSSSRVTIRHALDGFGNLILKLKEDYPSYHIVCHGELKGTQVLEVLLDHGIIVTSFQDISSSTRIFFENVPAIK